MNFQKNKTMDDKSIKPKETKPMKKESWDSGIKILKKMEVIIPLKLLLVCNQISDKVRGDEFSIVTNIKAKDDITIELAEDYYIPKQIVTSTSIEYLKDEYKFNCVIHRHPDGMNCFSGTDKEFINQNFALSILYTKQDGFVTGIFNLKHNDYVIQIPVECYVDYGIEDIDIQYIKKPEPLIVIDKMKRTRSRFKDHKEKPNSEIDLIAKHEWDSDKDKLLPEEKLDYAMMKDLLLEEVNEQLQGIEYRLDNIEEAVFHQTGFYADGTPF
jgi:hypothetical protein